MAEKTEKPRVVIAGGGVAGIETLLALRDLAGDRLEIEIVAPERELVYRPLSVATPFDLGDPPRFALADIASDLRATFREDAIVALRPATRVALTRVGASIPYDALVVASGAEPEEAIPGAFTYRGPQDSAGLRMVVDEFQGDEGRGAIVFAVPSGTTWPLPMYELALITAARIEAHGSQAAVKLVTPEAAPLGLFGRQASDVVAALLTSRGVEVLTATHPVAFAHSTLNVVPEGRVSANRVVALPALRGRAPMGVPQDDDGFIPVDAHGVVEGLPDIYAAGDVTASSIKQGGIATQQADVVASAIAARFGAPVTPTPFRPVLRGMLLTGDGARFMRAEVTGGRGESSKISSEVLWWPEGKIAGRFLSPYLSRQAQAVEPEPPLPADAIPVDVELASAVNPGS